PARRAAGPRGTGRRCRAARDHRPRAPRDPRTSAGLEPHGATRRHVAAFGARGHLLHRRARRMTTNPLPSHEPISLLVVEDELIVAGDLELPLHSLGYHVAGSVADAPAAVLAAERLRPDLVLMDIRLRAGSDGIGAAQEIWRRLEIPVIFLTAYSD